MSSFVSLRALEFASRFHRNPAVPLSFAAVLLFALSPTTLAMDWDIERVDDAINWIGSGLDIVVGDDGTPHIGHGSHPSQIIRYAVKQEGVWLIEEVDGYPTGPGACIALHPHGDPCLTYVDWDTLTFARRVGGVWEHEAIEQGGGGPLRFTDDGIPHIAYTRYNDPWCLRHAWKPLDTWQTETADPTVAAGYDLGLVLDDAGHPHISHWAAPNYGDGPFEERYTWWDGSAWQHEIIDDTGQNCNVFTSGIALDSAGNPHIAYMTHYCWGPSSVKYAVREAGSWDITTVDGTLSGSCACSLVLDSLDRPHVVYGTQYSMVGGTSELRYAHLDGQGQWVVEVVDADGDAGELNALALDPQGYLHIAYFRGSGEGQDGEVRYARSTTPVGACAGDVDGDGDTDLSDLAALLAAYGTVLGDPGYNANADFDSDDDVDLTDLAFLLSDYGCGSQAP
jgi:hypothetical protein